MGDRLEGFRKQTVDQLVETATRVLLDGHGAQPGSDTADPDLTAGMLFLVDGHPRRVLDGEEDATGAELNAAWKAGRTVRIVHDDPATMGTLLAQVETVDIHREYFDLCTKGRRNPLEFDPWAEWCRLVLMDCCTTRARCVGGREAMSAALFPVVTRHPPEVG